MQREVTFRNPQTVWLFDYLSFLTLSDEANRLIFLSERDWNMIWQATKDIDLWQSRVWLEANGENYLTVDDTQFETFQNWVSDMRIHLGDFEMIEEVLAEIRDAIQALVDKPCCPDGGTSGSRGSGQSDSPPNPYNQEETPDDPPPGFEDMEVFDTHKCNQAQDIVNQLKADLVGLSGIEYSAQPPAGIIGVLIAILLTPIPYDDLIALVGFLIYTALSYSLLATTAGEIDDDNENAICSLYSAPDVETARSNFLAYITDLADAAFPLPEEVEFVVEAVGYMLTNDSLNRLFTNQPTNSSAADCSECGGDDCTPITSGITFDFGDATHLGDGRYSIVAEAASGWPCGASAREIAFYRLPAGFRITEYAVTAGAIATCGTDIVHVFTGLVTPYTGGEATSNTGIGVPQNLGSLYMISSSDFTVEVRLCEIPA